MDEADRADNERERDLAEALRKRRPAGPVATGFCLYCGEPLDDGMRWCAGTDCEREWEWEQQRKAANGAA